MTTSSKTATAEAMPTRRAVLTGGAAILVATTGAASAAADTPLARLGREWRDHLAAEADLDARYAEAHARYVKIWGEPPEILWLAGRSDTVWLAVKNGLGFCPSESGQLYARAAGLRALASQPGAPSRLRAWAVEALPAAIEYEAADRPAQVSSGLRASEEADNVWGNRCTEIADAILAEPATCAADVLVKLDVLVRQEHDRQALAATTAELRRILGGEA